MSVIHKLCFNGNTTKKKTGIVFQNLISIWMSVMFILYSYSMCICTSKTQFYYRKWFTLFKLIWFYSFIFKSLYVLRTIVHYDKHVCSIVYRQYMHLIGPSVFNIDLINFQSGRFYIYSRHYFALIAFINGIQRHYKFQWP